MPVFAKQVFLRRRKPLLIPAAILGAVGFGGLVLLEIMEARRPVNRAAGGAVEAMSAGTITLYVFLALLALVGAFLAFRAYGRTPMLELSDEDVTVRTLFFRAKSMKWDDVERITEVSPGNFALTGEEGSLTIPTNAMDARPREVIEAVRATRARVTGRKG